jgi:sugar O-acyltransferase (sialic acid O-acetyltransferase NeuD family)
MSKVIIFGTGQTADIVTYYLENDSEHEIIAYTVDEKFITEDKYNNKPVIPFETIVENYPPSEFKMFIAIGYTNLNKFREEKYNLAKTKGYTLITYVNSRSGVNNTSKIGDNCFILEHQSIQPFATIENNCFIWGGVLIAHHSKIKSHCWITSESSIAGNTTIGERCFIGVNATIGHMVTLGDDCMVGAGTLITKSANNGSVFIEKNTDLFKLNSEQFVRITNMK